MLPVRPLHLRLRRCLAVVVVLAGTGFALGTPPSASADGGAVYLRPEAPVAARVADLLHRMTTNEKVGQLEQIAVSRLQGDCNWSGGALVESCLQQVLGTEATGSILSGGGVAPQTNTPKDWAAMINTIQR